MQIIVKIYTNVKGNVGLFKFGCSLIMPCEAYSIIVRGVMPCLCQKSFSIAQVWRTRLCIPWLLISANVLRFMIVNRAHASPSSLDVELTCLVVVALPNGRAGLPSCLFFMNTAIG